MWTLGLGWAPSATQGCECDPGLHMMGFLKSPVVLSGRKKQCCSPPPPPQSQTKLGNLGLVHLSPKAVACVLPPPSSIPLLLPLQILCSLVAKLISNSCAHTFPDQTQRNAKESPSPESAAILGLCCWVGVNEKYTIQWNLCPIFS